jgi:hypothetical protein
LDSGKSIEFWIADDSSNTGIVYPDAFLPKMVKKGTQDYLLRLSRNFGILLRRVFDDRAVEFHDSDTYERIAGVRTPAWLGGANLSKSSLTIV